MNTSAAGAFGVVFQAIKQAPWLSAILLICVYFTSSRLHQYWRLRQFKGPPTTGISWWRHSRAVINGDSHLFYGDVTAKYGPIARIAPNHLITSSPQVWSRINAVRSPYKRAEWYYHACRFAPGQDSLFTDCDNDSHEARRKKMAMGYSGKDNPDLEQTIDTHITALIALIRARYASTSANHVAQPMDLAKKIQYLALDVTSAIGLGKSFGALEKDSDINSYLSSSDMGLKISSISFGLGISWLTNVPVLGKLLAPSEKDETGFGRMMREARKCINERLAEQNSHTSTNVKGTYSTKGVVQDMLTSFIRHGVSGEDLFHEVFEQMLAGMDTTAAALRGILLYVLTHSRVYARLQQEIDAAVAQGLPQGIISDAQAKQLPYLSAVIKEGMRLHPPVSNLFSRVVPPEGDCFTLEGKDYFLPPGTMIGYSAWGMHRCNTDVYGSDAEVFRPERWLAQALSNLPGTDQEKELAAVKDDHEERHLQMQRTHDLHFGHGRWTCVGKIVAQIELHKTIFELLRHFDFSLTRPEQPWKVWNSMGLFAISDMWVDVTER